MEYITIATTGNSTDFGDLSQLGLEWVVHLMQLVDYLLVVDMVVAIRM